MSSRRARIRSGEREHLAAEPYLHYAADCDLRKVTTGVKHSERRSGGAF